ncbi:MAG: hypothetical protein EBS83_02230 [Planctomycetia bacterium]|nr:hypothetical protein [Planctomycetia bacterium]NDH93247.1 hypothetical protein [Planctomycetia bacterium]
MEFGWPCPPHPCGEPIRAIRRSVINRAVASPINTAELSGACEDRQDEFLRPAETPPKHHGQFFDPGFAVAVDPPPLAGYRSLFGSHRPSISSSPPHKAQ